ncbi:hypothetical protein CPB86DRAFT_461150 [Serendipita vermifera]|nr:hypothetical protein CPB86DRAFT_461150 [Serendipita vermifera]
MSSSPQLKGVFRAFVQYEPSEAACIVFIVAFAILLVLHIARAIRAKVWYMWPLIVSTALELLGYILREYVIHNRTEKTPYLVSQVFVIIAPACLAVQLYMLVGRTMNYVGSQYTLIRPSWITPTFLGIDIISIITQGAGSAVIFNQDSSTSLDRIKLGRTILILGLFIQLVGFAIFLLFSILFDRKATVQLKGKVAMLRPLMNAFYISGSLILLRSIYRAVEFIDIDISTRPVKGYLWETEWPYYVLDATPITLSILVYLILFPPNSLPKDPKEVLQKDEEHMLHQDGNGHAPYSAINGNKQ